MLVEAGLLTRGQLAEALEAQRGTGAFLGEIIVEKGFVTAAIVAEALSRQLSLPFVDLSQAVVAEEAIDLVPQRLAEELVALPLKVSKRFLVVAMHDPLNLMAVEELAFRTNRGIKQVVAPKSEILEAIQRHYAAKAERDEIVRELRRSIAAMAHAREELRPYGRVFSLVSNQGGEGKTHTAINLAYWLGRMGHKVLLIDADFGRSDVTQKLGLHTRRTFLDFVLRDHGLTEIVAPTRFGFSIIAGKTGRLRLGNLTHQQRLRFVRNFARVGQRYDAILMDLGASASAAVQDFTLAADTTIVFTTPRNLVAGYACAKLIFLRHAQIEDALASRIDGHRSDLIFKPRFIMNQVASVEQGQDLFAKIDGTAAANLSRAAPGLVMRCSLLGSVIYDDEGHLQAEKRGVPYSSASREGPATACYQRMAKTLSRIARTPISPAEAQERLQRLAEIVGRKPSVDE